MRSGSKTRDGRSASNGSRLRAYEDGQVSASLSASRSWRLLEKTDRERAQFCNARHRLIDLPEQLVPMKLGLRRTSFQRPFGKKFEMLRSVFLSLKAPILNRNKIASASR